MKILLRLFFVFVFAFAFRTVNSLAFAGGDGSLANPWQISTKAHLMDIGIGGALSASYILNNDIDISGSNWDPIGTDSLYFSGTFDGNGYTISGLTIDSTFDMHGGDNKYIGLFGYLYDASVTDLALSQVDINVQMNESNAMVGALAGQAYVSSYGPTISYITVDGTVMVRYYATEASAHSMYISTGGLLGGYNASGDSQISLLNNITSTADVSIGAESVVAGDMFWVYSGGIVGSAYNTGLVYSDYYGGEVNAVLYGGVVPSAITFVTYVGGLAGDISDNATDKFTVLEWNDVGKDGFDTTINGYNYVGGLVGRMDTNIMSDAQNCSATDLTIYGESYVGGFAGTIARYRFMASTANDITIYPTGLNARTNFGGLFGYIINGYVFQDTLGNIRIEGFAGNVGGVSGYSSITDYDTVLVNSVYIDSDSYVGGLVGYMIDGADIRYSFVQGNIDAHYSAGGLVGWGDANGGSVHIDKSGFYGDISVDQDEGINGFIAGGILGVAADGSFDIIQVSSLGSITGGGSLGGLIGEIETASVDVIYAYSRMALNGNPTIYPDPEIVGLFGSVYEGNLYVREAYFAVVVYVEGASSDYVDPFMGY
ncbi:MAG: hypothetical protein WCI62_01360, partial [Erysipelotrichaceae bacterium]